MHFNKIMYFCFLVSFISSCEHNIGSHSSKKEITIDLTSGTNMSAVLSPDGSSLALDLHGTLWILPSKGGEAKPITDKLRANNQR